MSGLLKRKWPDAAHEEPLESWSTETLCAFLESCDALPDALRTSCSAKAEADCLDGEVLSTLSEAELGASLLPALRHSQIED